MDTRELGLVAVQKLLDVEDLHYGLWDDDLELSLSNIRAAQQRYTEMVLATLPPAAGVETGVRVLDIGCGTGHMLGQMLEKGYRVDGVIPAQALSARVKEHLARHPGNSSELFECRFQDFPEEQCHNQYDVALFSESFQYIPMAASLAKLPGLLKPGGLVLISDFFKTEAHGDGGVGDGSFRGGHYLRDFYALLPGTPFLIQRDDDITKRVSPNLELLNDLLMNKIVPTTTSLDRYLKDNYPILTWLAKRLFRKKLEKVKFKYLSGHRSKEVFERYKTYRVIVLQYQPG